MTKNNTKIFTEPQEQRIRANHDQDIIVVYQAYRREIAEVAVAQNRFVSPPFNMNRMTWIKPSFLWMMYRSGWASKEGQECVLAIKILRTGFEWALRHSCLSHFDPEVHECHEHWEQFIKKCPVRIQWDPERDLQLNPLKNKRAIQIGLSGQAVEKYVNDWIVDIQDITPVCKTIQKYVLQSMDQNALSLIPRELDYPVPQDIFSIINSKF